ncbi:MAG: hypothetical protein K1X63_10630 [Chitinophagales bacterium]|nr:hypothetical protein [Chitinophagales bacterium]
MPTFRPTRGRTICVCLLFAFSISKGQTVTQLQATFQSGQVFLTWKNISSSNKRYKIYRSTKKINSTTKLDYSTYLGYVLDNSSKNVRKSQLKGSDYYFKTDPNGSPLASGTGLYVVTCNDNKKWYYAVTSEDVTTGVETRTITTGTNSLTTPVQERKTAPQPVMQATIDLGDGKTSYEYVIWGNNQSASTMPAFNNVGSYGYNFTFIQHSQTPGGLYVYFRDDDPFSDASPDNCENCNILLMDDWLPNGKSTYWFGYNENYDTYSLTNPVQSTGTIRGYTQARIKYILNWVTKNCPVDPSMVYASGFSHNGFGALLTANLIPEMIAAEWLNVAPPLIKAQNGSDYEKLWCDNVANLPTDVLNPQTGAAMNVWDVFDMRTMYDLNTLRGIPFIGAINGKQDNQVGWIQQMHWYDSLEYSREGGVWYWDQRQHNGSGKQFLDDEIKFELTRFTTVRSYPAFSNCSINQDPGNGSKTSGDPYGAINGYLDWMDASISDLKCSYSINCFIRDMYVNGVLQPQYDSCTTDVTFRRLQKFKPNIGSTITWTVQKSNGNIAASGTYIYDGGPITLTGIPIYNSGSTINLNINFCNREDNPEAIGYSPEFDFLRRENGYLIRTNLSKDAGATIRLFDMSGRTIMDQPVQWHSGENEFLVSQPIQGEFLLQIVSNQFVANRKLFF